MNFFLRAIVAAALGGLVGLSFNSAARPTQMAMPILAAALILAVIGLVVTAKKKSKDNGGGEASPREVEPPSGGGDGFTSPKNINGTVLNIRSFSGLVGQALPGVGHTVRVKLIEAGGGKTLHLDFGEGWAGALRKYHRGSPIVATGWVKKTTANSVYFVDCALAEYGAA